MAEREQGLPAVDAWQAVQLRVTLFGALGSRTEAGAWWKMVTGENPESVTDQPKVGTLVAQGPYIGGNALLRGPKKPAPVYVMRGYTPARYWEQNKDELYTALESFRVGSKP